MVFYTFLGLVFLGFVWWAVRSPLVKAHIRAIGHHRDPGPAGHFRPGLYEAGHMSINNDQGGRTELSLKPKGPPGSPPSWRWGDRSH